jgi:hypothetical protein
MAGTPRGRGKNRRGFFGQSGRAAVTVEPRPLVFVDEDRMRFLRDRPDKLLLCRKLPINTRLEPGAKGEAGKNRLNGFAWARSWVTALKRGVNEMISTEQQVIYS